jgi:hypothetical protein
MGYSVFDPEFNVYELTIYFFPINLFFFIVLLFICANNAWVELTMN